MHSLLFSFSLLLAVSAAPLTIEESFAIGGPVDVETPDQKFIRSDADKSNGLSFDEWLHMDLVYEHAKREHFAGLDVNKDQLVTRGEWDEANNRAGRAGGGRGDYFGKVFEEFDSDLDMSLSPEELESVMTERYHAEPKAANFDQLITSFDKDHSGGLDLFEFMKFDANFARGETKPAAMAVPSPIAVSPMGNNVRGMPAGMPAGMSPAGVIGAVRTTMAIGSRLARATVPPSGMHRAARATVPPSPNSAADGQIMVSPAPIKKFRS